MANVKFLKQEVITLKAHSQSLVDANQKLNLELEQFVQSNEQAIQRQASQQARYENLKHKIAHQVDHV